MTDAVSETVVERVGTCIHNRYWNSNIPPKPYPLFKEKLNLAVLPDIRFHDLRHTTASLLLERNVHPKLVSELLGHSNINLTLNTYSLKINPMNKVTSDQMDDMFGVS